MDRSMAHDGEKSAGLVVAPKPHEARRALM